MKYFTKIRTLCGQPKFFFFAVFTAHLSAGLLIQKIVLPYFLPHLDGGDGLVLGLDSSHFHKVALELLEQMNLKGWQAWELRPYSNAPSGIAALIYKFTVPKPWVLLPFNALLQAIAAFFFWRILVATKIDTKVALLLTIPFAFFPSACLWTTQLHKDGIFIFGSVLWLYGWANLGHSLSDRLSNQSVTSLMMKGVIYITVGFSSIFLVRAYFMDVLIFLEVPIVLLLIYLSLQLPKSKTIAAWGIIGGYILISILVVYGFKKTNTGLFWKEQSIKNPSIAFEETAEESITSNDKSDPINIGPPSDWKNSAWLPDFMNDELYKIAIRRENSIKMTGVGSTSVDTKVSFTSPISVIAYVPRALWIGFLSPFPDQWFSKGSAKISGIMRAIGGLETLYVYIALILMLLNVRHLKLSMLRVIMILVCVMALLPFVMVINNIGTVYRMRYLFLHLSIALMAGSFINRIRFLSSTSNGISKNGNL